MNFFKERISYHDPEAWSFIDFMSLIEDLSTVVTRASVSTTVSILCFPYQKTFLKEQISTK